MKRSEILYIIEDELYNFEPISRKNKNIDDCAKWILKRLEAAGMQPPPTLAIKKANKVSEIDVDRGIINFEVGDTVGIVNEWDNEDET